MLSEILYGTFANYSPRGGSALSQQSRKLCGAIKAGRESVIRSALPLLERPQARLLEPFLNPGVTLVPVPRSAPLRPGALWPSRVIAELLVAGGYGAEVLPCIERVTAVPKSAASPAKERPLWHAHYDSMTVGSQLLAPSQMITLVDDVLTLGRTAYACAARLHQAFPDAEIRVFAMIRTLGFVPDIDAIFDPAMGVVTGYDSGKTYRDP